MRSELTPFIVFVTVVAVAAAAIAWAVPRPLGNLSIIAGDNTTTKADNGMTTDNIVVNEDETLPREHHSPPTTIIEQGSGVETANYIIFHDDETPKNYYAKSGDTGEIVFGGEVAATVINDAITTLGATGGAVVLVEGTYEITASVNLASNVALVGQGAGTLLRVPDGHDAGLNVISGSSIDHVIVTNLRIDGNKANQAAGVMHGVYFDTVTHSKIVNCWAGDMYGGAGIHLYDSSDYNTVTGNTCQGNGQYGIYLYSSSNNTVEGNTVEGNSQDAHNTYDGIFVDNTSDYNNIQGNTVRQGVGANKQRYGINIAAATCDGNLVTNNDLYSSGATANLSDLGTGTKLETKIFQFQHGGDATGIMIEQFKSADASAKGWEIDAAGEWAISLGQLPLKLQQVVRIKIWAVALTGEADKMRLEININAGASDEPYTTEPIAVANKPSETGNFADDDVIYWKIDPSDDLDIGDLAGGDSLGIKVLHAAMGDGDWETDAVLRCVEIEYV